MISGNRQFQCVGLFFPISLHPTFSPRQRIAHDFILFNIIRNGENIMRSKYLCLLLLITMFPAVWFFNIADASEGIKWYSYEEGIVLAKVEKKKVFLHFYADWCGFCGKMNKETFQNANVISKLNDIFISIRVDTDKEMETAVKYGVRGLPANWFLTETGQPIVNIPGFIAPDAMLSLLKEVSDVKTDG
jgi:thiol:disulfide interchange protein